MELYQKLLAAYYAESGIPEIQIAPAELLEQLCYQALCRIQAVLADDSLDDPACF